MQEASRSHIAVVIFGCLLLLLGEARAQDAKLANIIVTNTRDTLLLYLTVKDAFPPKIESTVESGVPVTFSFLVTLHQVRNFWPDKQIANINLTHSLKYDTLKKEYIVHRSWEENKSWAVKTLAEAAKLMTEIDRLSVTPLKTLEKGVQYQIRAKAELSKLTLPFYLHYVLFFVSLWDFETDWYTIDFIF